MLIKDFIDEYNKITTSEGKREYIENTIIKRTYVPVLEKMALVKDLVQRTMYKTDRIDENGKTKTVVTDEIKKDSILRHILFRRLLIEAYTNLEIESNTFLDEYDMLRSNRIFDALMCHDVIPFAEIDEFSDFIAFEIEDVIFNETTTQAFVRKELDKLSTITDIILPIIENFSKLNESDVSLDCE